MNLNKHSDKKEQGSVLLVLLLISAIMGITLASYLIMANNQNTSVMRSMVWNGAMPVAEAGVEDALQMINKYAGNFETVTNWPSTYFQDKWTTVAPNVYYVRRYLSDTYYDVYVTNSNWQTPKIRSIGYALWRNPYGADTTTPFAQVGPSWTAGRTRSASTSRTATGCLTPGTRAGTGASTATVRAEAPRPIRRHG